MKRDENHVIWKDGLALRASALRASNMGAEPQFSTGEYTIAGVIAR